MNSGTVTKEHYHQNGHACRHLCGIKCVSWGAIVAGALVGIGVTFLFNLFGAAIGIYVFNMTDGMMSFAWGGLIGVLIATIISMFLAGHVAGYLGRPACARNSMGVIYGFTTWSLMLLLVIVFASYLGQYLSNFTTSLSDPATIVLATPQTAPESQQSSMAVTKKPTASSNQTQKTQTETRGQTDMSNPLANRFSVGMFIVFILFFVGALSSCIGGMCGAACSEEKCK